MFVRRSRSSAGARKSSRGRGIFNGCTSHVSAISDTCVAVENLAGQMSLMRDHHRKGDLLAKDITMRPDWHRDGEQRQGFLSAFDDAVFRCGVARMASEGGDIDTCLKIELRQVSRVVTSVCIVRLYVCAEFRSLFLLNFG